MLTQLTIRDFAIVDRLSIDWQPGLNVITGETGAGKSILLDAVGALLGDRLGPEVVRGGARRALVEGVFQLGDLPPPEVSETLAEYGLEAEDGELIVSREIAGKGGRGGARINGRSVPLSVLQELGERLVDLHGQSAHMALLHAREQLDYLDRYAGVMPARAEVGRLVRELRQNRDAQRSLTAEDREIARLQDRLRYEAGEIEGAHLRAGEEAELEVQRARLEHVERLEQAIRTALGALVGEDEDLPSATDLLGRGLAALGDAARVDRTLDGDVEGLQTALAQVTETAHALRGYADDLETDPEALVTVVERLQQLVDLKRKYGETVDEILTYGEAAAAQLAEFEGRADRLAELRVHEQALLREVGEQAGELSRRRASAATKLARGVERELADLRLPGARFRVSLVQSEAPQGGVRIGARELALEVTGVDRAEFLLATGADEEPRAIARVASGGELARIALALKSVLARAETRATLIFDEIDVGVGGRTAPVVGQKLRAVAAAGRQVLCVTHLPQVAAYADCHYVVVRSPAESRISLLDASERVEELAAMLAGAPTEAARESARELLARAASTP